ncbi:MAG: hypothetical protein IKT41_01590 [Clostridia bacterium]|nr:hypothetical protein [Clostridia bacterium]
MKQERVEDFVKTLRDGPDKRLVGTYANGRHEVEALTYSIPEDSPKAQYLRDNGCILIYPQKLTDEQLEKLSESDRYVAEQFSNEALIIDGNDRGNLSSNLATAIQSHYFKNTNLIDIDKKVAVDGHGSISVSNEKNRDMNGLKDIYDELGYETKSNERDGLEVKSSMPYPAVQKSKFSKIYDKCKDKLQGLVGKLKAIGKEKDEINKSNEDDLGR